VKVKCCVHQFNSGLEHCHDRGVLHHNIKGSHLLLDNNGVLKISNFGMASFFDFNHKQSMMSMVVTMWYELKKILFGVIDYGVGVDLWSVDIYLLSCWLECCSFVRSGHRGPTLDQLIRED
jgi:serine/threonine protein kinase